MNKKYLPILIIMVGFFLFVTPQKAFALTCTWNGGTSNFNTPANWNNCGGAKPGASDVATFDGAVSNASSASSGTAINVLGVNFTGSYSGTLTQTTSDTITVGTSGWTQPTGTFTGGSGTITIGSLAGACNGTFSVTSTGSFTSTTGSLVLQGNTDTITGTFTHNSGKVVFVSGNGCTATINSNSTFNNVDFGTTSTTDNVNYSLSTNNSTVNGTLQLLTASGSGICRIRGAATINAKGNITATNDGCGGEGATGTAAGFITINGTGPQTLQGDSASTTYVPGITINKASGTLTMTNSFIVGGDWTYTAGSVTNNTTTISFHGCNGCTQNLTGSFTFNGLSFGVADSVTYAIASGTIITATGTLTIGDTASTVINGPGILTAQGDLTFVNNSASGTVPITLSGSANQTVNPNNNTTFPSGTLTLNKSGGTITIQTNWSFTNNPTQDLLVQSGSTQTLSGAGLFMLMNDQFTISGTLNQGDFELKTGNILGTYNISSGGVWSNTSTGDIGIGPGGIVNNGTILFDGTSAGCGGADAIAITGDAARTWSGTGSFTLYDVALTNQSTSLGLTAYSSTNNGGNSGFTFTSNCPSFPTSSAAYWKFDEGQGTTTYDSATTASLPHPNGTLSGATLPTWQTEDLCISGKCLFFDGSTSYVTASGGAGNIQSVAMWVRPNNFTATQALIDLDGGTHTITVASSTGQITANGFSSPTYYVNGIAGNRTLTANQWSYVEITTASAFQSGTITIAKSSTTFFQGFIDEVRLFNTARTAQQVKSDYAGRGASVGASDQVSNQINNNPAALSNGLVGGWRMDDTTVPGTATIVQRTSGAGTTPTTCFNSSTCAVTAFGSSVAAGNGIVVIVEGWNSGGAPTITNIRDNRDGVTNYSPALAMSANGNAWIYIYYLPNTAGGATFTVTITYSGSIGETNAVAYEVSGVPTDSTMFNTSTSTTGTNATPSTGTVLAGASAKLAFATFSLNEGCGCVVSISNTSSGWGLGGTQTNSSTNEPGNIEHKAAAIGSTSVSDSWTVGNSNGTSTWVGGVATFNAAGVASSTAVDSSGNANTGTLNGNATYSAGKFGGGTTYDGTGDYVSFTKIEPTAITIAAWVNPANIGSIVDSDGNRRTIINDFFWSGVPNGYTLDITQQKFRAYFGTPSDVAANGTTTPQTGTWYHVVGTYDGITQKLYVNGVLEASTPDSSGLQYNGSSAARIGTNAQISSDDWNGKIDEVRIYNRALSPADVFNLYNYAPGPVGKWELEEGSGTSAIDTSSNANTGTITAGTGGYVTGKYGKAYNFDKASTKIDAGSGTTLDDLKNTAGLSAEAWIYPKSTGEGGAAGGVIIGKATGPTGTLANGWEFFVTTSNALKFTSDGSTDLVRTTNTTAGNVVTSNTWNHVAVTWDGSITATNVHIYINGIEANSYATSTNGVTLTSDATPSLIIGNDSTQADTFDGYIDNVKVYNYPRTQKQAIEDLNAGHPAPGSPVGTPIGWWKFDEGYGTGTGGVAHSSGSCGSACDATEKNMSDTAVTSAPFSAWQQTGKFGKALGFDGTNDFAQATADVAALKIAGDLTLSAWININSLSSPNTDHNIIANFNGSTASSSLYRLFVDTSGKLNMGISSGTTITTVTGNKTLATGIWYHVVGVYSTANSVTLYINGIQDAQNTSSIPAALGTGTGGEELCFGAELNGGVGAKFFNGIIDEPKVFAGALTADQVKIDMNNAQVEQLGAAGNNSSYQTGAANQEYCVPGDTTSCAAPVGEWKLEQGSGTSAFDTSGNGYTATLTNSPSWAPGKIGKGLSFTSTSSQYAATSTNISQVTNASKMTLEAWMKRKTTTSTTVVMKMNGSFNSGYGIDVPNDDPTKIYFFLPDGSTNTNGTATAPSDTNWHHYAMVFDGTQTGNANRLKGYLDGVQQTLNFGANTIPATTTNTSDNFNIGNEGNIGAPLYSDSIIDQVRIFDYARTLAQVELDYNKGAPIAWWKMDECTGTSIKDSSGTLNTGTLNIGGGGSQTAAGTCTTSGAWFNGVTGKRNYSVNFDGTDDYISVPDSASLSLSNGPLSMFAWVKPGSVSSTQTIIRKEGGDYTLALVGSKVWCEIESQSINTGITLNNDTWYFIGCAYDGTTHRSYVNGIEQANGAATAGTDGNGALNIASAAGTSQFYTGQIDDVKIFNYNLTTTQIKQLYNNGAVNFAPVTGAP